MGSAIRSAAAEIVKGAEFVGGKERVSEIATYGYKGRLNLTQLGFPLASEETQLELLNAIQDEAKTVSAAW